MIQSCTPVSNQNVQFQKISAKLEFPQSRNEGMPGLKKKTILLVSKNVKNSYIIKLITTSKIISKVCFPQKQQQNKD